MKVLSRRHYIRRSLQTDRQDPQYFCITNCKERITSVTELHLGSKRRNILGGIGQRCHSWCVCTSTTVREEQARQSRFAGFWPSALLGRNGRFGKLRLVWFIGIFLSVVWCGVVQ